jgi:hypothetical protein
MLDWLDEAAGPGYSQAVLWTLLALLLLFVLLVVIKLYRTMTYGTFVAGGRNRKARLAVMDATAIDTHRRLVLVRRDDTEHLLLIGGTTDLVVERDIHLNQPARRPVSPPEEARPQAPVAVPTPPPAPAPILRPRPPEAPRPVAAPRPATPVPSVNPAPTITPRAPEPARTAPRSEAARPSTTTDVSRTASGPSTPALPPASTLPAPETKATAAADDLDDALMKELQVSLDETDPGKPKPKPSLDDEMTRLLGELSNPRNR